MKILSFRTFFLISLVLSSVNLFSDSYREKLLGQWDLKKISDSTQNIEIPLMSTALWSFREDGTGYIRMEHQGKKEIIEFTWVLNDLVLTVTDKQGKDDKITFGFFEDYMLIMRKPDDVMLLKKKKYPFPEKK
ncbi:MAG TPA: hypothetical protein PL048_25120 [Leptospiraceae bacterium]|nr:hypothetical protein [Leptospiraceae bacterium]HMY65031.1 hypothetical protein [Leptospiraceae bacterium]HMZ62077.1 hypothetical protein [Leptospiraceae bacterium]HNF12725.1 hypothetical protein [Leptospiraceae bacterium]HNF22854.1 hypothetical protein [Leptospiraceae bacterium]